MKHNGPVFFVWGSLGLPAFVAPIHYTPCQGWDNQNDAGINDIFFC